MSLPPFTAQFAPLTFPDLGLVRFPNVGISDADKAALKLKPDTDNRTFLKYLIWEGIKRRRAEGKLDPVEYPDSAVIEQLKMEFATFDKTGVHDYLLLVWDINRWADTENIVRGWGRGSAASSLALFALRITHVNPLRHKLNFPRFISEARMKPVIKDGVVWVDGKAAPDIDSDYQYGRRADVVRYVERKYAGRTSKISTRLELTGKMALKDALKIYAECTEEEAKHVSDMIEARFGKVQSLHEALHGDGKGGKPNADIVAWVAAAPGHAEVYALAMAIEGLAVGKGQHPSGVFISYDELDGNVPTELSKTGDVVTSNDMETVAWLGCKVDLLGIRTLDVVADSAKLVGKTIDTIDLDDPAVYEYLNRPAGALVGLFQIEEGTTKEAIVKVGPRNIDDLSACLAISRPGALKYLDQYAAYVRTGAVKAVHPSIDEALKTTGNVLIFQEQITAICRDVFGLSGVDADSVRYAVGKKKREEMAKWESVIVENAKVRGIPDSVTKYFWDVCNASADYLFVLSHATSYAYLTAATTYLKALHPHAFYLTLLKMAREEPNALEYMNVIMNELRAHTSIRILPPDITKSGADFQLESEDSANPASPQHIRFGLSSIKGVSDQTMVKFAALRRPFATKLEVFDAAKAAGIPINVVVSLIYSGCLGWADTPRSKLALEAQTYNLLSDNQKVKLRQFIVKYGGDVLETLKALPMIFSEKGKPILPPSQLETLRRNYQPFYDQYLANSRHEALCAYVQERHYLGFSFSARLFDLYAPKMPGLWELSTVVKGGKEWGAMEEDDPRRQIRTEPFRFVAHVVEGKLALSQKNATPYYRMTLADDSSDLKALLYGQENVDACKRANEGALPEPGDIVSCEGTYSKDGGMVFVSTCIVQINPIKIKRSTAAAPEVPL